MEKHFFAVLILLTSMFLSQVGYGQADAEISTDEAVISSGETLFSDNCAVCHKVHERLVGPALKDVHNRKDIPWLKAFIRNSQKVIKSGDEYAVKLFEEYQAEMTSFDFSDEEIMAVLAYIKSESAKEPQAAVAQTATTDTSVAVQPTNSIINSPVLIVLLVALLVVLIMVVVVLLILIKTLTAYINQKVELDAADKEIVQQKFDILGFVKSPAAVGFITFLFVAIALKVVIDGLYSVGVQQNYQPTQPIAFSHKVHAGDFKIDCNYCHTGVMNSKNANIPSANICMNCHTVITTVTGQTTPSVEIKKIKDAVDNNTPIEWVRVHNLPDLAYFNHSQHFNVAGVQCQTCHGPVEEMVEVYQFADLTMGWCIDCHRTTDVNTKGNAYYDELVSLHEKVSKEPMKVEDIGGLECAKCHY